MFPYRVKYTDSESDIQNNDLLYKTHQKCQEIIFLEYNNFEKIKNPYFSKKSISK